MCFESGGGRSVHDRRHVFGAYRCIRNVKDRIKMDMPQTAIRLIVCLWRLRLIQTIDCSIGRRGCRDAKARLRKTTLMSWNQHTNSSHQKTIAFTSHHVIACCAVPSCCSPRSLKAHLYLKAIGHPITPSFRRNHSPDQSSITRKQLQQMAEHKVCCR